jgi:hypothetical protein
VFLVFWAKAGTQSPHVREGDNSHGQGLGSRGFAILA